MFAECPILQCMDSCSLNREFRTASCRILTGIASILFFRLRSLRLAWIVLGGSVSNTFCVKDPIEHNRKLLNRKSERAGGISPFSKITQPDIKAFTVFIEIRSNFTRRKGRILMLKSYESV